MRRSAHLVLLAIAVIVSGCSNASTDPHTGGLMGGIAGITTGAYERRLSEKQLEIADLNAAGEALENRVGTAQGRLRDLDRKIVERQSRIQRMKAALAEIDRMLKSAEAAKSSAQGALDGVAAANAQKEAIYSPLKRERDTLDNMVRELEQNQRIEAMNYERARALASQGGAAPSEVTVVELEKRSLEMDRREAEASERVARVKASAERLTNPG